MGGYEVRGLADRQDLGRLLVRDPDAVAVLELDDQLDEVQRVRLEVLLEAGPLADPPGIDLELRREVLPDAVEDLFARHDGSPTLAAGADLSAPACSSAAAVRPTMSSSTARRASLTACSIPVGPKLPCATTTGLRSPSRIAPPTRSGSISSRSCAIFPRIRSPPTLDTGPERTRSRMVSRSTFDVPSSTLSATFPVKPSVTTTSADALGRSKPSRLPTKLRLPAAMRSCAVSTSGVPLPDSSPTDSSPTRGLDRPTIASMKDEPIYANCTRWSGRTSTLAPASSSRTGPPGIGSRTASAGRNTPCRRLTESVAAASVGPVLPADTSASARPSPTARAA